MNDRYGVVNRTNAVVRKSVDFSIVLVLPFSALVAFTTLIVVALMDRSKPRLIWPFAFSTISASAAFLQMPGIEALGYWLIGFGLLALWSAFGTLLGAMAAKMGIAAAKRLQSQ